MKFLWFITIFAYFVSVGCANPPNIIFILADDLGWNDVGFHGSGQIPTPNIDALAYSGIILNNYYVMPICTPSRSAIMTGQHPIYTGMQHGVLYGEDQRGLPLNLKILPQYLNELGYSSHIVGKWHLGSYKKEYTPLYRGFKSHLGPWTGHHDYNDHTAMETNTWGLDMRRNMTVAYDLHGQYSTDVFTKESVRIIDNHNKNEPLFLYVAHVATHSGNPYNPLPAPDDVVKLFDNITDFNRRKFAGMLHKLDESVGEIVKALQDNKMLENSVIVFSTDNGGPAAGFNLNAASNWPLRGVKNTLWEGGVRGSGVIWSKLLKNRERVSEQMFHVSDWLPTLYSVAGGDMKKLPIISGVNMWPALSDNTKSPRTNILHNIDDIYANFAFTKDDWKVLSGTTYGGDWDKWYLPSGRNLTYDELLVVNSPAGRALAKINASVSLKNLSILRSNATVTCIDLKHIECNPLTAPCLFNVKKDPCEVQNLADRHPEILQALLEEVQAINKTAVSPGNLPLDPRGDPKYWNYTWTNFGDYLDEKIVILV